jgi:dihydroxy-acid dehydratase
MRVLLAIGGSTNAHRAPDRHGRAAWASRSTWRSSTAWAANAGAGGPQAQSGEHYMETSTPPAAWPRCCARFAPLLHLECLTVTGRTLGEEIERRPGFAQTVVRTAAQPI